MQPIQLIVGLCNPGKEYEGTRHNAGAFFVQELARQCASEITPESKFHGSTARVRFASGGVWTHLVRGWGAVSVWTHLGTAGEMGAGIKMVR